MAGFDGAINGLVGIAEIGIIGGVAMGVTNNMMKSSAERDDDYRRRKAEKDDDYRRRKSERDDELKNNPRGDLRSDTNQASGSRSVFGAMGFGNMNTNTGLYPKRQSRRNTQGDDLMRKMWGI